MMTRKKDLACGILSVIISMLPLFCYAQAVSSQELISRAKEYDGRVVAYEGEVIGEVMPRGAFAWVNINDGKNAIGCWMQLDLARAIQHAGSYKAKGDWIEASGIFNRACPEHGGDLDIHVRALRTVYSGRQFSEHAHPGKQNLALILLGAICLILMLRRFKIK
jgi:hypothetical protein